MKIIPLPVDLGQAVLNYLVERPYREVFQLVPALQALPVVETQEAPSAAEAPPDITRAA